MPADESIVASALDELTAAALVTVPDPPHAWGGISRRQALRALGMAAGASLLDDPERRDVSHFIDRLEPGLTTVGKQRKGRDGEKSFQQLRGGFGMHQVMCRPNSCDNIHFSV
ncbi:MAG: hypothetical protein O2992_00445 [Gemmatimonadetes bacterium]|nr:hypothetical protein [Gemmatimonadota bacterium]